jgi:hypothetical protein
VKIIKHWLNKPKKSQVYRKLFCVCGLEELINNKMSTSADSMQSPLYYNDVLHRNIYSTLKTHMKPQKIPNSQNSLEQNWTKEEELDYLTSKYRGLAIQKAWCWLKKRKQRHKDRTNRESRN